MKGARRLIRAASRAERDGALEKYSYNRYDRKAQLRERLIIESVLAETDASLRSVLYLGATVLGASPILVNPKAELQEAADHRDALIRTFYPDATDEERREILASQRQEYESRTGVQIGSLEYEEAEKYAEEMLARRNVKR